MGAFSGVDWAVRIVSAGAVLGGGQGSEHVGLSWLLLHC